MKKAILFYILIIFPLTLWAASGGGPGETIIHHLVDSDTWKPLPYVPGIPLPTFFTIGGVTIALTAHSLMMIFASILLALLLIPAFKKKSLVPRGIAAALEPIVFFVRNDIVYPAMGEELGEKWWPFFNTVFLFILTCNLMGLIPLFNTATGNINVTLGLAVMVLFLMFASGIKAMGPIKFITNMIPKGAIFPIGQIILLIELLGFFIKSFALCLRLFANMLAGHIVILALLILIFMINPVPIAAPISIPLALFINFLEILVALIQAIVFTLLASIFIGMASHHH